MQTKLTIELQKQLIEGLKQRFEQNMHRHEMLSWQEVEEKLLANDQLIQTIFLMEDTEGEPDVVQLEGSFVYADCSKESPKGRRSLCYDDKALQARKANKPAHSALKLAQQMGVTVLNEQQYRSLQKVEAFDLKSSSWIQTPDEVRQQGGALFCDYRYNMVFVYHNGAESYYATRGFRSYVPIK